MATSQSYTLRWTSWLLSYKELKIELVGIFNPTTVETMHFQLRQ